ncbi:MAG: hypothetical protein IKV25_01775 [Clostridia bacterium]|nr:hypothetical protein [Clostridia bacterium]
MENKRKNKRFRVVCIILVVLLAFRMVDFGLSEWTDLIAYKDAVRDDTKWEKIVEKINGNSQFTTEDYEVVLSQTGLGKPAFDSLVSQGRTDKIEEYREYFLMDKDYYCYREGVFACHESIQDGNGEFVDNPPFADIRNGDILVTLSIHSLGWRHGHAAIVTDAEKGVCVQAVMVGAKSNYGYVNTWKDFPMVALLRVKDENEETAQEIASFAESKLMGLPYSLFSGIITGRDSEKIPFATQCAHLVWYAYYHFGIDISPQGGRIITPYDFLKSEKLEVVQVYGSILEV